MGCNCGDNEFNIEIENNGSCEPTTPIYNISLGNVGVSGFSPKVNFVNETTSGFQIQTIDINGEELSGIVPKLDYINSTFLTQADAATTYLTVNGSNANNPISINGINLRKIGTNNKLLYTGSISDSFAITTALTNTAYLKFGNRFLELGDLNYKHIATTSQKAYYTSSRLDNGGSVTASEEIATVGDVSDLANTLAPVATSGNYEDLSNKPTIPTVGNGLILINQGGVTKGAFRLNQSEDYILNLDAGGGGSVTNPIVFTESSTETSAGITTTTTGTLTLGLETTGDINPALKIHYKVEQTGEGGIRTLEWDEYLIDRTIPAINGGLTATTNSSSGRYIRNMSVNVDNSTIKINGSGQLYADITVPTYTAGDAIDITSDVIGVKIDGTSITLNQDGELQSSGSVPSIIDGGNA